MREVVEPIVSVVVPVFNESGTLESLTTVLHAQLQTYGKPYELIFVNDGSLDQSVAVLHTLAQDPRVRIVSLIRNFGKEVATTAGIHVARGQAIITLDGDGQHPVDRLPDFLDAWNKGAKVVIGVRATNTREGLVKRYGSKLFYALFNRFTSAHLVPGATDYRLIDRVVQQDFKQLTERNRITRGLIDWLGYPPVYIQFDALPRTAGTAGYSFKKLLKLAVDSVVSLSISPLYVTAYIGAVVLPCAALLGVGMALDALIGDPLHLHATGGAYVTVFILFLIGILLVSQGIIGLYLSHIHTETQNRPLYVVDRAASKGVSWDA